MVFDDDNAVANAGLLLSATLAGRLGLERLVDETLDLGIRPGAFKPGRKVMSLVHSLLAGGDSIDDTDVLRAGSSQVVQGPSRPTSRQVPFADGPTWASQARPRRVQWRVRW